MGSASPIAPVTALILAGGFSTRMGQDKAPLVWAGTPLLRRVYEVAHQVCDSVSILTPWPERYVNLLPSEAIWLRESPGGQGPLVALAQGLRHLSPRPASTPWVLLLACDLPLLQGAVLHQWLTVLPTLPAPTLACVPYHQKRWEPLCGFYHRDCTAPLEAFMAQGGRSLQRWLTTVNAVPLTVDPAIAPMFWNCNRPTDLLSKPPEKTDEPN